MINIRGFDQNVLFIKELFITAYFIDTHFITAYFIDTHLLKCTFNSRIQYTNTYIWNLERW